jgi:aminoglycoside phosphotransferase family enzyme/predicted kinase
MIMDSMEIHRQLLDPATYPEPTGSVSFHETHISRVYLTDNHAYKLKKPLNLGFLDYSTLEKRHFFCQEETRLNRRFAPQTYLGVVALRNAQGRLRFNGSGVLVDYAVLMQRLPETRMLDHLLDSAAPELPGEIERLARHLPSLFMAAPVCREDVPGGNAVVVRANCVENLRQTEAAIGHALSMEAHRLMASLSNGLLEKLTPLLRQREAAGFVRDGHGDLHARNICMTEPIQVYDCIEFCRRFRVADMAAELAFLLMDLDFRGRQDLARQFLETYHQYTPDHALPELLPFYKSYRAWVRGKVESLLAGENDVDATTRQQALAESRRYFNLALGYHAPAALLMTSGLMGVGKSTLARNLALALGGIVLRSDVVRKELAGIPLAQHQADAFGQGLYSSAMTASTYAELYQRARRLLKHGETVIIDASFARKAERKTFLDLAVELDRPAWLLHVHCDRATVIARLDRRRAEGRDASDGRRELLEAQADIFEALHPGPGLIEIDSSNDVDYNVQAILCQLLAT